ncbi:Mut7-C RNAse domain-containing protein [Methanocalculus sp. MC3]
MTPEPRFLVDRMLGPLTRYLRLLGYDTESADCLPSGNPKEDTELLQWAEREGRILLTRDRELAGRAGEQGIYIGEKEILDQLALLKELGRIDLPVRLIRCSICNSLLEDAPEEEIRGADYAPAEEGGRIFRWCPSCRRLYWMGSHTDDIIGRMETLNHRSEKAP